jgi:hypothetical protein
MRRNKSSIYREFSGFSNKADMDRVLKLKRRRYFNLFLRRQKVYDDGT